MARPALPSYETAAKVLEDDKGSGWKLAGWTVVRAIPIALPMMLVGVEPKRALVGAGLASVLMSVFVLLRIFDAQATGLAGLKRPSSTTSLGCRTMRRRPSGASRAPTRR